MGFKDLFNKRNNRQLTAAAQSLFESRVNQSYIDTGKQIQEGLSKTCASTGTPIENLHGAAKATAIYSNIGGGSKAVGGGGMEKGIDTLNRYSSLQTAKKMIDSQKYTKISKKK